MAIKATIYKIKLEINDCDRDYFQNHELTISCHPSETEQRMMVRVVAFALYASENLSFTKGLCADDEPELWEKNLCSEIELWISLGQVEEKQIRKSLGRSKQVVIFTYAGNKSNIWWGKNKSQFEKMKNLTIINIKPEHIDAVQELVSRNMHLQCTIQDGTLWLGHSKQTVHIEPEVWLGRIV
ncbi:MAG: YaeQ family protein [Gammaproteobacteria bacterium]|nr:YaeQ family protein [Gammaproteobacteria bacterium]